MTESDPCVITFKCLNQDNFIIKGEENDADFSFYYDKGSNKTIVFEKNSIKISNKDVTNMKINIHFQIDKNAIKFVTTDRNLMYLLIIFDEKENDDGQKLNEICIIDMLNRKLLLEQEDNYFNLLGVFFISKDNNIVKDMNIDKDKADVCFVFIDKIIIYQISYANKLMKQIQIHKMNSSSLIKDFSYNRDYRILCCILTNNSFDFYNLSNEKYYSKRINHTFYFIKLNIKKGFFKSFQKPNAYEIDEIRKNFNSRDKYTKTQYYLENIYDTLYFICLCYEDNKIHICNIKNFYQEGFDETIAINYDNRYKFSCLQFVDNLIIIHNMLNKSMLVIDLKDPGIIISESKAVNFPYEKNLILNGPTFEEKNNQMKGLLVYSIKFNSILYTEITYKKLQKYNENKNNVQSDKINILDTVQTLLRRKNSKESIIFLLKKLLLSNKYMDEILNIMDNIIKNICDNSPKLLLDKIENLKNEISVYTLPGNLKGIVSKNKSTINQREMFNDVFKVFIDAGAEIEQDTLKNIFNFLYYFFANIIHSESKVTIHPSFLNVLAAYIKNITDKNLICFLHIQNSMPNYVENAEYFYKLSNEDKNNKYLYLQIALDSFKRLRKYERVLHILIDNEYYYEAFEFFKIHYDDIPSDKKDKNLLYFAQALRKSNKLFYLENE